MWYLTWLVGPAFPGCRCGHVEALIKHELEGEEVWKNLQLVSRNLRKGEGKRGGKKKFPIPIFYFWQTH